MPEYDFRSLSSYDFQNLCRDLLQEDLGTCVESFAPNMDRGIDARAGSTILQVKHYANSDLNMLTRTLERDERPKIETLRPQRYILATSLSLSVPAKDKILALLTPYCQGTHDIMGREDINNLLGRHPDVERRSFKLWLTSTTVLERVLHSGIWDDTSLTIDRIRRRTAQYVTNPSLPRARTILEEHHSCILAGIPGIGKTTLAEILMLEYLDQREFEVFRISESLREIKPVRNAQRKQLFYFDDFLGKTTLDKLERNEDQRLIEFMDDARRNPNWRFLMTTREYILNTARLRYETLANADLKQCVVDLGDYTRRIRAEILYNHLYFSDLHDDHKYALLEQSAYRRIIRHKNYSPRIIEHITKRDIADAHAPAEYEAHVLSVLDNPQLLWAHAFDHQLSSAARNLLLVLITLPEETAHDDAMSAFTSFHRTMHDQLGFRLESNDFRNALRELDGTFIKTDRWGPDLLISLHNPSVQDFLEHRLVEETATVRTLLDAALFFEQLTILWRRQAPFNATSLQQNAASFVTALERLLESPTCIVFRSDRERPPHRLHHVAISLEERIRFIHERAQTDAECRAIIPRLLDRLRDYLRDGHTSRENLVQLLTHLHDDPAFANDASRIAQEALPALTDQFLSLEDCEALTTVMERFPGLLNEREQARVREQFLDFCSDEISNLYGERDVDALRDTADRLYSIGTSLGIDVIHRVADLWGKADEIEEERRQDREPYDDPPRQWQTVTIDRDDDAGIDTLFASLREELRAGTE
ncbi:MAG TPA: hypothetical protein VEK57_27665 [Thermoanaerobaculia bacterium]|nr:hypothetical protein [Thermoanaerobaculia bacterium]